MASKKGLELEIYGKENTTKNKMQGRLSIARSSKELLKQIQ